MNHVETIRSAETGRCKTYGGADSIQGWESTYMPSTMKSTVMLREEK